MTYIYKGVKNIDVQEAIGAPNKRKFLPNITANTRFNDGFVEHVHNEKEEISKNLK